MTYSIVASRWSRRAWALEPREAPGSSGATPAGSDLPVRRFAIPSGPLRDVLAAFQRAMHLRVTVQDNAILMIVSPGVSGLYTIETGLKQLLAGTGVGYRFTGAGTILLGLEAASASVDVVASGTPPGLSISLPKFPEPVRDTPQSIDVVPREVMDEQGSTTLRDALRNVAGISLAAGEGGSQGDNLTIRGFTARNDFFLDGMRDFGSYYRDPFNLEQIDVLQGPTSVTFGRGTTGGIVNQESKVPELTSHVDAGAAFGSDLTRRLTADIDEPLPELSTGAAFRFNVMGQESDIAGRDIAENRRFGLAPSLALGLGTPTRFTFSYFHQTEDDIPDYGVPWLFNAPAPVRRQNYYGFEDGNFLRTYVDIGTVGVEHDFSAAVSLRSQARYAHYVRDVNITEPQIAPLTASGAAVTPGTPLDEILVNRHEIAVNSVETYLWDQTDVTARFATGGLAHVLIAGVEGGRETSDPVRFTDTNVPLTSLVDPDESQPFSGNVAASSRVRTVADSFGIYILDTVKFRDAWELTGGARWDRFDTSYEQAVAPASSFRRVDEMPTWRAALVYKPASNGSIYLDAGTSFNPSAETLSLSAANANAPPEKNRTWELGTKWDLAAERLSLRAALFRTEKTNAREPDPTNPLLNVLGGDERVEGFEIDTVGHLTDRWQVLGGYALMDGKVVSSQFYSASVGGPLANVPKSTFNFWTTFEFPWRLEIGGGGQFVDSRVASSTVQTDPTTGLLKEVPGYWVFNAMAMYRINDRIEIRLNVYNLANRYYLDEIHPGHIVPGAGTSGLLSLNFKL